MIERAIYLMFLLIERLLGLLPLGLVFRAGCVFGDLIGLLARPYRRLVLHNLQIAFGDEKSDVELREIRRRHFQWLGGNLLSGLRMGRMPAEKIREFITFEHTDRMNEVLESGRGVVLLISHFGNWELFGQLGFLVPKFERGTIYQALGNRYIDAHFRALRNRFGIRPLDRREGFTKALQILRGPGLVGVLVDQHAGDQGIWVPFFGRLASTSTMAATMALRTNALVLPASIFTEITPDGVRWRMKVDAPVEALVDDIPGTTALFNEILENQIRQSPADWFWVHNRWKTPKPKFLLATYKRGVHLSGQEKLKPFRIAVRSPNWLGDAVMSIPAVQSIRQGRPDAHVTVLVPAKIAPLWERVRKQGGIDAVVPLAEPKSFGKCAGAIRDAGPFDVGVLLPNSLRSALEMRLGGIAYLAGFPGHNRSRLLKVMPKPPKQITGPPPHHVDRYGQLAQTLGADFPPENLGNIITSRHPEPQGRVRIGLCAGAEYGPAKRWPAEDYAAVAAEVARRREVEWVLFGVGADDVQGTVIQNALGENCRNLIGRTTLEELMDELQTCRLLLTNDTGTMHLAAWLGVPVVALFGSTEPALTGPRGSLATVIRHHVACSPCFLRECPLDFRCMKAITHAEVTEAVLGGIERIEADRG